MSLTFGVYDNILPLPIVQSMNWDIWPSSVLYAFSSIIVLKRGGKKKREKWLQVDCFLKLTIAKLSETNGYFSP